ncbi:hypothetical protein [Dyella lutea]|uniref:Uncharacterized protein n=1 Tax=Dyella lutea TaxID=2950441 RepID=A0ABT1FCS3_9GAMM|nr:hypothetical protein [Dyella lutea]MCP1375169.1 hypothetical protein [Dyella lutea]
MKSPFYLDASFWISSISSLISILIAAFAYRISRKSYNFNQAVELLDRKSVLLAKVFEALNAMERLRVSIDRVRRQAELINDTELVELVADFPELKSQEKKIRDIYNDLLSLSSHETLLAYQQNFHIADSVLSQATALNLRFHDLVDDYKNAKMAKGC